MLKYLGKGVGPPFPFDFPRQISVGYSVWRCKNTTNFSAAQSIHICNATIRCKNYAYYNARNDKKLGKIETCDGCYSISDSSDSFHQQINTDGPYQSSIPTNSIKHRDRQYCRSTWLHNCHCQTLSRSTGARLCYMFIAHPSFTTVTFSQLLMLKVMFVAALILHSHAP